MSYVGAKVALEKGKLVENRCKAAFRSTANLSHPKGRLGIYSLEGEVESKRIC